MLVGSGVGGRLMHIFAGWVMAMSVCVWASVHTYRIQWGGEGRLASMSMNNRMLYRSLTTTGFSHEEEFLSYK